VSWSYRLSVEEAWTVTDKEQERKRVELTDSYLGGRLSRRAFMQRLLALGLSATAAGAIVAACASASSAAPTGAPSGAPTSAPSGASTPAALAGTVKYLTGAFREDELDLQGQMIADFAKTYPQVAVSVDLFDWGNAATQVATDLAAGGHDVYYLPTDLYANGNRVGGFADISPFVNDPSWAGDKAQFRHWDRAAAAGQPVGQITAVPYLWSFESILFVNLDLLDKTGMVDTWGQSYETMREALNKITVPGDIYGLGMNTNGTANYGQHEWYGYMLRAGTHFENEDLTKSTINTPEFASTLQMLADMMNKDKCTVPFGKFNWQELRDAFAAGKIGMSMGDITFQSTLANTADLPFKFGVFPFPPGPVNNHMFGVNGWIAVNVKSNNKDAAWAWTKHLTSKQWDGWYCDQVTEGAERMDAVQFADQPDLAGFLAWADRQETQQDILHWNDIMTAVNPLIEEVYLTKSTPADALARAEAEINKIIANG
jgi:ABC-type glycerol-3-phosphate transport system substrate-binding protein